MAVSSLGLLRRAGAWQCGLALLLALGIAACGEAGGPAEGVRITGATMGTTYAVTLPVVPEGTNVDVLKRSLAAVLDRVDTRMSTYRADSELSRFNRSPSTDWVAVSDDTRQVVEAALAVSRLSGGAFDVTVAPLVNLWGFGSEARREAPPPAEDIERARQSVGYEKLHVRRAPPALRKDEPALSVDLSAIAKGFAVDQVAQWLEDAGVERYLVEIGGELRARGTNPRGVPWRVAVEKPLAGERAVEQVIGLVEGAVATSGDYRNYFERDGRRFSHTIDPRTGAPIDHQLASVTVLAGTAMRADALATAISVLGSEAGFGLAAREGLAVFLISKGPGGFTTRTTPAFDKVVLH